MSTKNIKKKALQSIRGDNIREAVDLWFTNPKAANRRYGHISEWDVREVTDMSGLFKDRRKFDEDISKWDVSNVTNMREMFFHCLYFNQYLNAGMWVKWKI